MRTKFFETIATLLLCIVGLSNASAQDVQMATLQHGETVSTFYGADALKSAHDAAEAGDQICLSGGTFTSVNITKAVKIYGAGGFVQDVSANRYKTVLNGDFTISLPEGAEGLLIEGITNSDTVKCNGDIISMTLRKSYFNYLYFNDANTTNCRIDQCRIKYVIPDAHSKNFVISNTIYAFGSNNESDAVLSIINCVQYYSGNSNYPMAAIYKNSIINGSSNQPTCSFYNSVLIWVNTPTGITENCKIWRSSEKNFSDFFVNTTDYELTEEWKTELIGDDNTEMGIYGGSTPFSNVPSNPQVTTKTVAEQADANGKLSVKMVVEAQ